MSQSARHTPQDMQNTLDESDAEIDTSTLPDNKYDRLRQFLSQLVSTSDTNEVYVKSKNISDDVGLSPQQIGAIMTQIQERTTDITVEKWSYTRATTWRIAHKTA